MRKTNRSLHLTAMAAACGLGSLLAPAAQSAERIVLYEQFTATWCYYCQFAGQALTQMLGEVDNIAVLQVHVSDAYSTSWGNARDSKYGVGGIPHVVVDGVRDRVGAGSTQQAYNTYMYDYNWRLTVPTSVTVTVTADEVSPNVYDVSAELTMDADGTAAEMEVHLVETLNHYPSNITKYNYCVMQGFNQATITLEPGETELVQRQITLTAASQQDIENVRFVAFAQVPGYGNTEVFNAGQVDYPFADPCPADLDGDGYVGQADLATLLASYNQDAGGDIDGDGDTDQTDLAELLSVYNTDC
jgi:hypothetical protein